jgi:hypothetical protein
MCTLEVTLSGSPVERFYTPLTLAELQAQGFEKVQDDTNQTTILRRTEPFFWAYPFVLEAMDDDSMLIECLQPATAHKCEFWSVAAEGVLADSDVFPIALFPLVTMEKLQAVPTISGGDRNASTASVREMEVPEQVRTRFEERVFNARFLGSIERTGMGGPLELQSRGCPTMAELVARSEDGSDYVDETVSAMWFGFKLALQHAGVR